LYSTLIVYIYNLFRVSNNPLIVSAIALLLNRRTLLKDFPLLNIKELIIIILLLLIKMKSVKLLANHFWKAFLKTAIGNNNNNNNLNRLAKTLSIYYMYIKEFRKIVNQNLFLIYLMNSNSHFCHKQKAKSWLNLTKTY
jgi:hypothetical protein